MNNTGKSILQGIIDERISKQVCNIDQNYVGTRDTSKKEE
jgi:hypothetical protein